MNAPVIGAEAGYAGAGSWSMATSWRYQKSDRHFRGSDEQEERQAEGSEVINRIHMLELAITKNYSDRWSLTFGIPYFMMERSNPLCDPDFMGNTADGRTTLALARNARDEALVDLLVQRGARD